MTELRRLSPGAKPAVLDRALALLRGFTVGAASERRAVLWGHDAQVKHGALVSRGIDLARADALRRVAVHVNRMTTILASIDLEAACGLAAAGLLGRIARAGSARIDTREELTAAHAELDQLLRLLAGALPDLVALRDAIERHWLQVEAVGDEAEALALAAEVLALRLHEGRPSVARVFFDRSIALIQTVAQVRSGASLREAQAEQPLQLIAAIQDVALVQLPAWLAGIAALEAAAGRRRVTPTEAGELAHRLRAILQTLNP